ncbi:MAG: FAD-dependent oxidoreductase [Peptostreptococcaceae bacterium]
MKKIIVIGGGWAGCAAAIQAKKSGADVLILERTDMLLGLGNVGGIMRNNGRYSASEEMISLGANELFDIIDTNYTHKDIEFPGHKHATIYDVMKVERVVRDKVLEMGIEVKFISRVIDVNLDDNKIISVVLANNEEICGDAFIDTTGTSGPMGICEAYGNGCSMCVLRCPAFGGRVSITAKCGLTDMIGKRNTGEYGAFSGSMKLLKESLGQEIQDELNEKGSCVVPIPENMRNEEKLDIKVCQQYALKEFSENVVLIDTGHAKLMSPFYPIDKLRKIPGFEGAMIVDPYAGGKGNSIRYAAVAKRDSYMRARGICNLFVGGEKSGFYVGHTEAICTGTMAGYNASRYCADVYLFKLPTNILIGDFLSYSLEEFNKEDGNMKKFTFAGSIYFERMKELDFYTIDKEKIQNRIEECGLTDIFKKKVL